MSIQMNRSPDDSGNPAEETCSACPYSNETGAYSLPRVRMDSKLLKKSMTLNTDKYIILKQRNWICDVTPLQDELGFVPAYPLRRGLEESIEWYRKEGWL